MNTEQLNQKIANMEAELASMKALVNKPKPVINYWQPKPNKLYWYVNEYNNIKCNTTPPSEWMENGHFRVFKTETEAQKYAEYIKAEETLRKAIAQANEGWVPDWSYGSYKYVVGTTQKTGRIKVLTYGEDKLFPNFMYIKSSSIASNLITLYEKEFRTYLQY